MTKDQNFLESYYPDHVIRKAQQIELLAFDVDGVLTDGGLYYDNKGNELKKFYAQDGHGIKICLLYTSPSPRDLSTSRMPSSA